VRLPTEAEWEFACRAGSTTKWAHGDDPSELKEYAWIAENSGGGPKPVGTRKPNAWGIYDMQGNVCERVADFYHRDFYKNSPHEDPFNKEGRFGNGNDGTTITRGCTWKCSPDNAMPGRRGRGGGYAVYPNWGLRAAVTALDEGDAGALTTPVISATAAASGKPASSIPATSCDAGEAVEGRGEALLAGTWASTDARSAHGVKDRP
jgi:hypothetical protein